MYHAMYASMLAVASAIIATIASLSRRLAVAASLAGAVVSTASSLVALLNTDGRVCMLLSEVCITPLRAYNLLLVSLVYLLVALSLPAFYRISVEGEGRRLYIPAINATFALLLLLVLSNNIFMMWVLLELSTLLTVYLVAIRGGRASEAAWKYLIICGVGMAFSLYGLVLIYSVGVAEGIEAPWLLTSLEGRLKESRLTLLATLFIIAGFSVKAGLFPGYMWLPDAYAEAPHPVSALLGGVLTYMPLYSLLLLLQAIPCHALVSVIVAVLAILSILTGAAGMLATRDAKRLYAYSSIEHMGILALLLACYRGLQGLQEDLAGLALVAFNLHALAHAIAKASVFIGVGGLEYIFRTRSIDEMDVSAEKWIGWPLFAHTLFLAGIPPSPLFISELLAILVAAADPLLLLATLVSLFAGFAALSLQAMRLYAVKRGVRAACTRDIHAPIKTCLILSIVVLLAITVSFLSGVELKGVWGW